MSNVPTASYPGDYDDPPCGTCGCMNHFCAADCDCCPEHRPGPAMNHGSLGWSIADPADAEAAGQL